MSHGGGKFLFLLAFFMQNTANWHKKSEAKSPTYIFMYYRYCYCSSARSRSARYFSSLRLTRCKALSMDLTWRPKSSAIS